MKNHKSPFQAMKSHNDTYRYLKHRHEMQEYVEEYNEASLALDAERLGRMIRAGSSQTAIKHYAAQVRYHAERLGVMIHIPA